MSKFSSVFYLPVCSVSLLMLTSAAALTQDGWVTYKDERGTRIDYPAHVFSLSKGRGPNGIGHVFTTQDGRARLHMYSVPNSNALSPEAIMRSQFPVSRSRLTYDKVTHNFFAISTRRGNMIAYLRCNFSSNAGGSLHCAELRYPASEKKRWDSDVTRISRSLH